MGIKTMIMMMIKVLYTDPGEINDVSDIADNRVATDEIVDDICDDFEDDEAIMMPFLKMLQISFQVRFL